MKNDFIDMIKAFADILTNHSFHFLIKNFEDGAGVKEVMDVVVSSHISALFNVMTQVAKGQPESEILVENFISGLETAIKNLKPIQNVEKI
jgi:hypothetical protein